MAMATVSKSRISPTNTMSIFPQGRAQGRFKALCLRADFALVDQAFLIWMNEFDRVFDRYDVFVSVLIDPVNHRRQRCRFAASRRSRNDNQTFGVTAHLQDGWRQSQFSADKISLGICRKTAPTP